MLKKCCPQGWGSLGSPPDWMIGTIAAIMLCFFILFLVFIIKDLFAGEKVKDFKLRAPHSGRMRL